MKKNLIAVTLLLALGWAMPNVATVSDPSAKPVPADPAAPLCKEVPIPLIPGELDVPPPFGTVVQQWSLTMSGAYAGAAVTWRRDSGRFYLMDQGYSGATGVWSVMPDSPVTTIRREPFVFPNFGMSTRDIPWGIAWDDDSSCFWITNILDNSVYAGCHLVRMRFDGDTWRYAPPTGFYGDTWRITEVMGLYWMGGLENWIDRGFFCGTPVASGGSANNTAMFEPYTKNFIGNVASGPTVSERGCALIPFDSLYILTTGWNERTHRKRDTTGLVLQQVSVSPSAPADWAMWVPEVIVPTDTAFVFCMYSDGNNTLTKVSTGMTWAQLPSVPSKFDVRPVAILSPSSLVDSGTVITPTLVVRNGSDSAAMQVKVDFTVRSSSRKVYHDSTTIAVMAPHETDTLYFAAWAPAGRDSMTVISWVYWDGDSMHRNDTLRKRFLVRVKDVCINEITAPVDTVDSGIVIYPEAYTLNLGNQAEAFNVEFSIGGWVDTGYISLIPGGGNYVGAPDSIVTMPGVYVHRVTAMLPGDQHPRNNVLVDTFWVRGTVARDAAVRSILAPVGGVDTATNVTPRAYVANYSLTQEQFWTYFVITDRVSGLPVYTESLQVLLNPADSTTLDYPMTRFPTPGLFATKCSLFLVGDQNMLNDVARGQFVVLAGDLPNIGVTAITQPAQIVDTGSVITPTAVWHNYGASPVPFAAYYFVIDPTGTRVYGETLFVPPLSAGRDTSLRFPDCLVRMPGQWLARCSTYVLGDTSPANDVREKPFSVQAIGTWPYGWTQPSAVPSTPSGKAVKEGGFLAWDMTRELLYVAKGYKTGDFYSYDPMRSDSAWTELSLISAGIEGKMPAKGANGCSDNNGMVYAVKGNNTAGFWRYDAATDTWKQMKDVPLGVSRKRVKAGADLSYVPADSTGTDYVYLLKGYKNEFYRYSPEYDSWQTLPSAPAEKYGAGSWLAYDDVSRLLYAHQSKDHGFHAFDPSTGTWSSAKAGMPLIGRLGKSKKSKDGGSAAYANGSFYALKGGNTQEFWCYDVATDSWTEMDTIPAVGTTGKKKKIKAGADIAAVRSDAFLALKGNKTLELWRYVIEPALARPAARTGAMAQVSSIDGVRLSVAPNPLVSGHATLSYALPGTGRATLRIFDVAGRNVLQRELIAARTGGMTLDLRSLRAGVYLVQLSTEGFTASRKLLVTR